MCHDVLGETERREIAPTINGGMFRWEGNNIHNKTNPINLILLMIN
jgi:hypothetical protein